MFLLFCSKGVMDPGVASSSQTFVVVMPQCYDQTLKFNFSKARLEGGGGSHHQAKIFLSPIFASEPKFHFQGRGHKPTYIFSKSIFCSRAGVSFISRGPHQAKKVSESGFCSGAKFLSKERSHQAKILKVQLLSRTLFSFPGAPPS